MAESSSTRQGIAKRAGIVAGFTLLSRLLGFVRDWVMAHFFGASAAQDAFIAAQTIPYTLRRLVAEGSLMIAYVPLMCEAEEEGGIEAMRRFTAAVLGLLVPFLIVLVGLGMLFPGVWVDLFSAGFDAERRELATQLTRLMMPFLFFVSLTAVASGALNARGIFGAPAAAPMLLNLSLIVGAWLGHRSFSVPIEAVGYALSVGGALQLLLQVPFLMRAQLFVGLRFAPREPRLRTLLSRMGPAVLGVAVYQLNIIVIRQVASFLPGGQLSCYFLASRLEEFALGVFAVSVSIAALPSLSKFAAQKDKAGLLRTYKQAIQATNFITIPAAVGLLVMATPIVGVMFRHGRFTAEDAALTAHLVQIMALAIVPIGWVRITVPTYYALGDTKTPVWAAGASLLTTASLSALAYERFEIQGLTTATLIAALVQAFLLKRWLNKRILEALGDAASAEAPSEQTEAQAPAQAKEAPKTLSVGRHMALSFLAILPGAILVFPVAKLINWYDGTHLLHILTLAVSIGAVAILYFILGKRFGLAEPEMILGMLKRRLRRS